MREIREIRVERQSSRNSSTTQIMEDELVKGQVESMRSHLDDSMRRVNDSLSEQSSVLMQIMDRQSEATSKTFDLILQRLREYEQAKVTSTDQSGGFVVEPQPEPEIKDKSVQPQAPDKSIGSEEPALNPDLGASSSGVPTGEEDDEGEKARQKLLLQSGAEYYIPKRLKDGSSLTEKFGGYPSDNVVDFLERAEEQLKYCPGHFWHVYTLNTALGQKVMQMATVHQKTLLSGRMPDRLIAGKLHVELGIKSIPDESILRQ